VKREGLLNLFTVIAIIVITLLRGVLCPADHQSLPGVLPLTVWLYVVQFCRPSSHRRLTGQR